MGHLVHIFTPYLKYIDYRLKTKSCNWYAHNISLQWCLWTCSNFIGTKTRGSLFQSFTWSLQIFQNRRKYKWPYTNIFLRRCVLTIFVIKRIWWMEYDKAFKLFGNWCSLLRESWVWLLNRINKKVSKCNKFSMDI